MGELVLYVYRDDKCESSLAVLTAAERVVEGLNRNGVRLTVVPLTKRGMREQAVKEELEQFGVETLPALVRPHEGGGELLAERSGEVQAALRREVEELEGKVAAVVNDKQRKARAQLGDPQLYREHVMANIGRDEQDEELDGAGNFRQIQAAKMRDYVARRKALGMGVPKGVKKAMRQTAETEEPGEVAPRATRPPRAASQASSRATRARSKASERPARPRGMAVDAPQDTNMSAALQRAEEKGLSGDDRLMMGTWLANQETTTA